MSFILPATKPKVKQNNNSKINYQNFSNKHKHSKNKFNFARIFDK